MEIVIFVSFGVVIGCVLSMLFHRTRAIGSLRVDNSDPDSGPYLFLELSHDVGDIRKKKYVTLKVNLKSYISQE